MLFNSYEFIFLFLPITFFLYFFLLKIRLYTASKAVLVFMSLFFYSWWDIEYLPLLMFSLLLNYVVGGALSENIRHKIARKSLLILGVFLNLALLAYYKYTHFIVDNYNSVFSGGIEPAEIILPLAISFFTFQQIAYLVDSYRQLTKEYDFLNYTLFVTFFPQLISGPIVHHKEMIPQFSSKWNLVIRYKNIALGLMIFSLGLFKKVVIADSLAVWADYGYDAQVPLEFIEAWMVSLSFTFQLYYDFSGYVDMATGAALLFNIKLPRNFNSPYKALNIQDFWRRWHITLSRFLRDYVYIPLGGNKSGKLLTYRNILITFVLGGIWHGAGWTFVVWGLLHGLALIIHRLWSQMNFKLPTVISWFLTFNFINITWVFFRAENWQQVDSVLSGMVDFSTFNYKIFVNAISNAQVLKVNSTGMLNVMLFLCACFVLVLMFKNTSEVKIKRYSPMQATFVALIFIIGVVNISKYTEFIYFNF